MLILNYWLRFREVEQPFHFCGMKHMNSDFELLSFLLLLCNLQNCFFVIWKGQSDILVAFVMSNDFTRNVFSYIWELTKAAYDLLPLMYRR